MDVQVPSTDHDLLIEVSTNVKNLTTTITASTLATTQVTQDHEHRIRSLEAAEQQSLGAQKSMKNGMSLIAAIGVIFDIALAIFVMVTH